MTRRATLVAVAACAFVAACDKDPASAMKIAAAPAASAALVTPPVAAPAPVAVPPVAALATSAPPAKVAAAPPRSNKDWRPAGCPPPGETDTSGPSTLDVTGSCAFQHHGKFSCEALGDDLYISMTRKASQGRTLMVYINVENYKGPGDYKRAQMFVGVQDPKNIFRWSNDTVALTVGPDQAYAMVPSTRLEGEPLLVDCTGPMDNYQCEGRGQHEQLLASAVVASGKLVCDAGAK